MRRFLLSALVVSFAGVLAPVDAQQPNVRQGDVGSLAGDFIVAGEKAAYVTGASIATADLNGDGVDDMIYGVPFAAPNQLLNAGEVHVFFGRKQLAGQERRQVVRFSSLPDVIVTGENRGDRLGTSVAAGDVNGDGRADLIVGAGGYTVTNRSTCGAVFVLFGRQNWPAFYVLAAQRADIQVIGNTFTDKLGGHKTHVPATYTGQAITAADLNNDGIDDLVCGAPDANFNVNSVPRTRAGAVYVFYGQRNWPASTKLDLSVTAADITVYASHNYAHLGACFATGDFNGDNIDDLAIGEPEGNTPGGSAAGMTHVIHGRTTFPPNFVLDLGFNGTPDFQVLGDNQWDQSGYSLDMGDVNGDGVDDLLVGAWRFDPKGRNLAGGAYLFYGSTTRPPNAKADLNVTLADLNFYGQAANSWLGYRARITDFDGDGNGDVVLSAAGESPNFRQSAGAVYVVRGGRFLPPFYILDLALANTADHIVWGDTPGEYLGQAMGVGDVNGDGVGDIIQGGDLTAFGNANTLQGRVVVTYGGPLFPTSQPRIGTTMTMTLTAPDEANKNYVCGAAGSAGTGIPLGPGQVIPLDIDPFFLLSAFFPGNGIFLSFQGTLDATGRAAPRVAIPNLPGLAGVTLFYSGVVLDPTVPGTGVSTVCNRVHATMIP